MDKFYDADGVDITEKVKAHFDTQTATKVKEVQDQLAIVQGENTKLKEKDANFETLKTKYETETADLTKKITDLTTSVVTDKKNEVMRRFTGGNKELTDKIEAELTALGLPMTNAQEIETAITKSAAIVGVVPKNTFHAASGHMGGRGTAADDTRVEIVETPEQRQVRLNMGITDAMAAKYTPVNDPVKPLIIDKPAA